MADTFISPCPYVAKSDDGTKHFVMLTKPTDRECIGRSRKELAVTLRAKYKLSGVYENGDPATPVWTFDEDWGIDSVLVANDGSHIFRNVVFGRGTSAPAFTIYKNGKILRTFTIGELVKDESALAYTTSRVHWSENLSLDNHNSRFNVKTVDGISYSIDLDSGDIVREEQVGAVSNPEMGSPGNEPAETSSGYCFGSMLFALFGLAATIYRQGGTKVAGAEIEKPTRTLGEFLAKSPLRGGGDQLDLSRSKDLGRSTADTVTEEELSPSFDKSRIRPGQGHK